ncbi:hypothetical protein OC503_04525 [Vibrio vulnificus]|nr:hypothetical protein [Vibrio vulnificus]MCU8362371.1 hypothetical protein [Vibrio vulnificus]MCU8366543.1 hypothetical protein [Vibrio vulnificus]HAS6166743.1 hypothetical protein [Vibrio vulnificus]HAU8260757.1 hypothetical protein [Vibrio vulnificus]
MFWIKAIGSFIVTGLVVCNYTPKDHIEILAIASPLATIAGILFGVIIASVTFFSSVKDNHLIEQLKSTKMYDVLLNQLSVTGALLITSCIFMVLSIFSPSKRIFEQYGITYDYALLIIGFFCLILSLLEFQSSWSKIRVVIKNM